MIEQGNIAVRYRIDAEQSRFTVQGSAQGLLSMFGHDPVIAICGFGGDARFVPGTLAQASLLMLVQANSLAVVNKVSEKDHREIERAMRDEVLEIALYPEIVFMSTKISATQTAKGRYQASIAGKLTLHGVTRDQLIDARLSVDGANLRAQGEFALRQTDYNIKPVSVAGGTLKMKDELKLSFDITAITD
ncbi:MAG: YceI family protein [Pyrinomonadaceae bacterium]